MAKIVVDAGHGGADPGAVYEGRKEKDDNLRLALAVGEILEDNGQDVVFTRTEDIYQTPFQKAVFANEEGADYFLSIHRNSSPKDNQYNGVETLVYADDGLKSEMARNINSELEEIGFRNIGVKERPGLVVLKRTEMPALLVEAGFINSDQDNQLFDEHFLEIAQGIAKGMLLALEESAMGETDSIGEMEVSGEGEDVPSCVEQIKNERPEGGAYRIQTGAFAQEQNATKMLQHLLIQGFPADLIYEDGLYKVLVGEFEQLDNAGKLERVLRRCGYTTFIRKG